MKSKKSIRTYLNSEKVHQLRTLIIQFVLLALFFAIAITIILFARGYRFDTQNRLLSPTGILAVSSSPKTAKVYINGDFKGVTDINLTLPPGTYKVEIKKDGYTSYTKTLVLRGEIVEAVDPILFPINPSLSPITNLGILKAVQVDRSDRSILFTQNDDSEKDGIYLFDAQRRALSLFPPLRPLLMKSKLPAVIDFNTARVYFANDYTQAIIEFNSSDIDTVSYLVSLDKENQEPFDITNSKQTLLEAWETQRLEETAKFLEALPRDIQPIASDSFSEIAFSPDKTKMLYRATKDVTLPLIINPPLIASNQTKEDRVLKKGSVYTYDKREDKNYYIGDSGANLSKIVWYIDSKRLVYKENDKISISLYDGEAHQNVYSGPIQQDYYAVTTDGRVLILANLNPLSNKFPDVYQVSIR